MKLVTLEDLAARYNRPPVAVLQQIGDELPPPVAELHGEPVWDAEQIDLHLGSLTVRDPERLDLEPASPGEWLAAVGLTLWAPGGWVQHDGICRWAPWRYEHRGPFPDLGSIGEALRAVPDAPPSRWMNRRGNSSTGKDVADIQREMDRLSSDSRPSAAPSMGGKDRRTEAGIGWEIDESWARQPGALGGADPGRPLLTMALALIGAASLATARHHWPRPSVAVGHLWEHDIGHHPNDGMIVTWRRANSAGAATAGPLKIGTISKLSPPNWKQLVSDRPVGAKEIAEALGVKRQTVDMWQHRDLLPVPNWTVGGRPAWKWSAIEEWAQRTGRLDGA